MNRDKVIEIIKENKTQIEKLGAFRIGLFGSYARSENNSASDIDLIIDIKKDSHTFDNFMNITIMLEDIFGKKVDLLTRDSIDTNFYNAIKSEIIYV